MPPPLAPNFFIFMQFSGKIGQIIGWHPPLGLVPPPLGNPGSATVLRCEYHSEYHVHGKYHGTYHNLSDPLGHYLANITFYML